jgi:FSR family fosmidomycin resistance protein-like MFS transporter
MSATSRIAVAPPRGTARDNPVPAMPVQAGQWANVAMISAAHLISHFHMLVLPPLFPLLKQSMATDFLALGFALTLSNVVAAALQTPMGFLVDRWGGRRLLIAALVLAGLAYVALGLSPTYPMLLAANVALGIANTVYHPADYAMLSALVSERRMGRAFALHTFAGYLGFAVAPISMLAMVGLVGLSGALIGAGVVSLLTAVPLMLARGMEHVAPAPPTGRAAPGKLSLWSPTILMLTVFFALLSLSSNGLMSFGVVALMNGFGTPLDIANAALTGFLFATSAGVLAGGLIADRISRHGDFAAFGFGLCAVVTGFIGLVPMAALPLIAMMSLSGFLVGVITPSRDLLVRRAAPPGAAGRVFGIVTTGFLVGGTIGPLLFGWLMDHDAPRGVFGGAVAFMVMVVLVAIFEQRRSGRKAIA